MILHDAGVLTPRPFAKIRPIVVVAFRGRLWNRNCIKNNIKFHHGLKIPRDAIHFIVELATVGTCWWFLDMLCFHPYYGLQLTITKKKYLPWGSAMRHWGTCFNQCLAPLVSWSVGSVTTGQSFGWKRCKKWVVVIVFVCLACQGILRTPTCYVLSGLTCMFQQVKFHKYSIALPLFSIRGRQSSKKRERGLISSPMFLESPAAISKWRFPEIGYP